MVSLVVAVVAMEVKLGDGYTQPRMGHAKTLRAVSLENRCGQQGSQARLPRERDSAKDRFLSLRIAQNGLFGPFSNTEYPRLAFQG
jgi:hypothetical protein